MRTYWSAPSTSSFIIMMVILHFDFIVGKIRGNTVSTSSIKSSNSDCNQGSWGTHPHPLFCVDDSSCSKKIFALYFLITKGANINLFVYLNSAPFLHLKKGATLDHFSSLHLFEVQLCTIFIYAPFEVQLCTIFYLCTFLRCNFAPFLSLHLLEVQLCTIFYLCTFWCTFFFKCEDIN